MALGITSSNILFDSEDDSPSSWPYRRELLAKTILSPGPMVIATQEGKRPQLKDLESLLPDFQIIEDHRNWITTRMYPSFFIHSSVELLAAGDIWLSETPYIAGSGSFESMFPRVCCWIKIKWNQQSYLLVNCHLDHIKPNTRLNQIKVLIKEVTKVNTDYLPLILMGDFNEGPEAAVRKEIATELKLKDPWMELGHQEESTYHKNLTINPPVGFNGERIDWMLVDPKIETLSAQILKNSYSDLYPSDHYPIFTALRL